MESTSNQKVYPLNGVPYNERLAGRKLQPPNFVSFDRTKQKTALSEIATRSWRSIVG